MIQMIMTYNQSLLDMPFTVISIHGASIDDFEKITFSEYENCDTFKKYVKVVYVSDDIEYINVFNESTPMPKFLDHIYDYCKKHSVINYLNDDNLYVMVGTHLFKKNDVKTALMVSDKNIIGQIVDNIHSDANDSLSTEAIEYYQHVYEMMMKYKFDIIV